jgi:hypothetical protein
MSSAPLGCARETYFGFVTLDIFVSPRSLLGSLFTDGSSIPFYSQTPTASGLLVSGNLGVQFIRGRLL